MNEQPVLLPPVPDSGLIDALREQRASIRQQRTGLVEHLRAMLKRQDADLAQHPLIPAIIAEDGWAEAYEARSSPSWLAKRRAAFLRTMVDDLRKRSRSLPALSVVSVATPSAAGIERLARLLLRVHKGGGRDAV